MKSLKFIFSLIILGNLVFFSCKQTPGASNAEAQLALIPANASIVFEVNGGEILAKSGLNKPEDYQFMSFLKLAGGENYAAIESLLKGSKDAGVSLERIVAYFVNTKSFGVSAKILDKKVFEERLLKMSEGSMEIKKSGDVSYVQPDENFFVAWNNNYIVLTANRDIEKVEDILEPKKNGLYAENEDFRKYTEKSGDFRLWMQYGSLLDLYKPFVGEDNLFEKFDYFNDLKALNFHGYLNFLDGKIEGNAIMSPESEFEKISAKYPFIKEKFNQELFKDLPELSYFTTNLAVNINEYLKFGKNLIAKVLDTQIGFPDKQDEINKVIDSDEVKTVVAALDGDILFGIHGFNGMIPDLTLSFSVKNEDAFNSILKLVPENVYKKSDGFYELTLPEFGPVAVYFAYKDNRVVVSNARKTIDNFTGKSQEKTFADNPVSKLFAAPQASCYFNLDLETYPESIKSLLKDYIGYKYKTFVSYIEIYESIYLTGQQNKTEGALVFKNKNVNSLKQILKNIDKNITSLF